MESTDGANTWKNISTNKGFPKDTLGNHRLSDINTEKLYAIVESKSGGLYVSNDAGDTWMKQNDESKIRQRGWYFNKVFVDPKNENIVYICNVSFYKSTDGNISNNSHPHGDHHNLWIDPEDGQRMIIADDGARKFLLMGAGIGLLIPNQPTRTILWSPTDNHFPYQSAGLSNKTIQVYALCAEPINGSIVKKSRLGQQCRI
ncbi:MAG: hypothetical protein IPI22_01905 [Bacteroidetes bacterium]|nr:hypothetical protein [Bacteroidota bacterium]